MTVSVVSQYYWPEMLPINALCEGLAERGHDVRVLTGLPNYPTGRFAEGYGFTGPFSQTALGTHISRIPLIPRGSGSRIRLAVNYLWFCILSCLVAPFWVSRRTDIVLANMNSPHISALAAVLIARLRRRPLAIWMQDLWPESLEIAGVSSPWLKRLMKSIMDLIYRKSDLVFVQSRAFIAHACNAGVEEHRIIYLPNWADEMFRPIKRQDAFAEDHEMPNGFRVILAGNIGSAQSIPTVIEAARLMGNDTNVRIIVIGDGRMRTMLEEEILRLGLSPTLTYLGHRSVERMPFYYAASDVLLVTLKRSITMAGTIPSRLQACLAAGRPVIAAMDGEASSIIERSGAGIVCPAEDAKALVKAIHQMAKSQQSRLTRYANAARACSLTEFNREILLERVEAAFSNVVDGRQ